MNYNNSVTWFSVIVLIFAAGYGRTICEGKGPKGRSALEQLKARTKDRFRISFFEPVLSGEEMQRVKTAYQKSDSTAAGDAVLLGAIRGRELLLSFTESDVEDLREEDPSVLGVREVVISWKAQGVESDGGRSVRMEGGATVIPEWIRWGRPFVVEVDGELELVGAVESLEFAQRYIGSAVMLSVVSQSDSGYGARLGIYKDDRILLRRFDRVLAVLNTVVRRARDSSRGVQ